MPQSHDHDHDDAHEAAGDEPVDPRVLMQQQAQAVAMELLRTAELAPKLKWEDFDFGVDLFDPVIDDFGAMLSAGDRVNREALSVVIGQGLDRHFTLDVRLRLIREIGERLAREVMLDVREQARTLMRALHQVTIGGRSIGLVLELYPRHILKRLQERQLLYQRESRDRSIEDDKFIDALIKGDADAASLESRGERAIPVIEKALLPTDDRTPPKATALALIGVLAKTGSMRAARLLSAALFDTHDDAVLAAIVTSLAAMPQGVDVVENHIAFHDPDARTRRQLFAVLAARKTKSALPLILEDAFGIGPWSQKGDDEHARLLSQTLVALGDRRVVPMVVHIVSVRPPTKTRRAAILDTLRTGPWRDELDRALKAQEDGQPIVVTRDLEYEMFLQKYAKLTPKMDTSAAQLEVARVSRLYQECYHEELDWRTARQVNEQVGPRERDLLKRLAEETQQQLGRLAGRSQVAALEAEYRSRWMTTPQNDISGRVPLAIILDERAERDPEQARYEREMEADNLYLSAMRQHEAKMDEDARQTLRSCLQLLPTHAMAKDALEHLERGEGIVGIDEGAAPAAAPRIILPE